MEPDPQPGRYNGVGKAAAVSAVIFIVSLGLCGISLRAPNHYNGGLAVFSLLGMGAGVLGLLGSLLAAILVFFTSDPKEKP